MVNPISSEIPNELPLAAQLYQMICGTRITQSISVAARLGIADLLKDGPKSVEELATATDTHAPSLYRVMRALVSLGIFAETDPQRFDLAPLAQLLLADSPDSLRDFAIMMGSEMLSRAWSNLMYTVQTGEYKRIPFEQQQHPAEAAAFQNAMTSMSKVEAPAICNAYDFSDFPTIVDVGGGHGLLLATILKAYPALKGVLFELPSFVEGALGFTLGEGLSDRCEVIGGDFFATTVPKGGDAYILKHIIHDWDNERAVEILRNCREAMAGRGRVLIAEVVISSGKSPSVGTLMDIQMLVGGGGGMERTEAEFSDLLSRAGFHLTRIIPTKTWLSIVEGVPI